MTHLWIALIVFVGVFGQSAIGFGLALLAMPLLTEVVGLRTGAPLVAAVAIVTQTILVIHYRRSLRLRTVGRLVGAAALGVPVGVWGLQQLPERAILALLGVVLVSYALYAWFSPRLPELRDPRWAYAAGFLGGTLGGAFNTSGPPVILYASCRQWERETFKSNLQGYFLLNSAMVIVNHALKGNYTPQVWEAYLWALPSALLGLLAGISVDRYLKPAVFHKVVLVVLMVLGIRLILKA